MFARLCALDAGDLVPPNGDLASAWIELQNSQGVVARRQRLNLTTGTSGGGTGANSSSASPSNAAGPRPRSTGVCHAARGSRRRVTGASAKHPAAAYSALLAKMCQGGRRPVQGQQQPRDAVPQRRPPQPLPAAHQPHHNQQQQQQGAHGNSSSRSSLDPLMLSNCIQAASTFGQLEAVCNTFLGHAAFTSHHAALALSRLHSVHSRATDSQLLLVELLARQLARGCASTSPQQQQELSCWEVAAAYDAFSRAGYQPDPELLQQLLHQFWRDFHQQQQHHHHHPQQQQQQQPCSTRDGALPLPPQRLPTRSCHEALATLVAGLAGLGCRDAAVWAALRPAARAALQQPHQQQPSQPHQQQQQLLPIQALQQLVWGFAAAQQSDAPTSEALAAALTDRLQELGSAEELAHSVWCMHLIGSAHAPLYEAAAALMVQRVQPGAAAGPAAGAGDVSSDSRMAARGPARSAPGSGSRMPGPADAAAAGAQQQRRQTRRASPSPQRLLSAAAGETVALCVSTAAGQAFGVLQQYDPLACMLAVYRKHYLPA